MLYNPIAIKLVLIDIATDQWLSVSEYTTLVALELGILQPDRDLRNHVAFLLGSLTTGEGLIETKRVSTDTGGYSYVSRKYTPPDLKDVETEDAEISRQLKVLNVQVREMFNADPVMARIYNMKKSKHGEPFVICRRHYDALKKRLATRAPQCILQIIALVPIGRDCSQCEDEKETKGDTA